jgi:four helix bundle protein
VNDNKASTFQDLLVWRKAHHFVLDTYHLTTGFPKSEMYGLAIQMRRAAVSIPANIAEGFKRRSRPDKVRFLNIAQASAEECRYYAILVQDLAYAETSGLLSNLDEVTRLLGRYLKAIEQNASPRDSSSSSSS